MSSRTTLIAAAVVFVLQIAAPAQERVRHCQDTVASRLNVAPYDVQTSTGPRLQTGKFLIPWHALAGGDDMRGYCVVNLSGRVTTFHVGDVNDPAVSASHSAVASRAAGEFEQACRIQSARRLRESPDSLRTEVVGAVTDRTRVNWKTTSGRTGFCVLDSGRNLAVFHEEGKGSAATFNARRDNEGPTPPTQ